MVDLGCGDGRLLVAAASDNTNVQAIGYELSLFPYILAHTRRLMSPHRKNIHIHYGNALTKNLRDADIVYSFLMPKIHTQLKEKFTHELKPGAKMITYVWPIEGLQSSKISTLEKSFKIYLYER
jgi:predicted RNA methylase